MLDLAQTLFSLSEHVNQLAVQMSEAGKTVYRVMHKDINRVLTINILLLFKLDKHDVHKIFA